MNRKEAKELLVHILMTYEPKDQYGDYDDPEPYEQAITMAIEALSEHNCVKCKHYYETEEDSGMEGHCKMDTAYREEARKKLMEFVRMFESPSLEATAHIALSERTGKWIFNPKDAIELMFTKPKCSKCGFESADGGNFCSNCGADMRGREE